MTTTDITRALRNRATHAATLARWQSRRPAAQLATLRKLPSYAGRTLAERRAYAMQHNQTPELSAQDSAPVLWIDDLDRSPEILRHWQGREFLRHSGWYTDDYQDETLEAYAVQLADFPGLIFEATRDSMSGTVRVYLDYFHAIDYRDSDCDYNAAEMRADTARDAIRSADSTAEREAEKDRDYQAEEDRKRQAEEARDDLKRNRATVRALIADLRELCPTDLPTTYPAAAAAVKRQLADLLKDRSDLFDQLNTLES